ncbi:nitrilase-related carbon-nitrogen hydrolase [Caulobacter segnis]
MLTPVMHQRRARTAPSCCRPWSPWRRIRSSTACARSPLRPGPGSTSARPWCCEKTERAANRQAVIDPTGAIVATYDKLHMFDVDLPTGETARESATYTPGERAVTVQTPLARSWPDHLLRHALPGAADRALALDGATVPTTPAAFTRPMGEAHWDVAAAALGHRNRLIRDRRRPGRLPRGRPRHLGTLLIAIGPWARR